MWTINDAKEGDILVYKWREDAIGDIFIFKGIEKSHVIIGTYQGL